MISKIETRRFSIIFIDDSMLMFTYKDKLQHSDSISTISINTQNTWEINRNQCEINKNTLQGKIVEDFFIDYIEYQNSIQKNKLSYLSYDAIRADGFKKHAPFDGILYESNNPDIDQLVKLINDSVSKDVYGKVPDSVLDTCRSKKCYLVEIKSSKIPDKIKREIGLKYPNLSNISQAYHKEIFRALSGLDLFKYPKFNRTRGRQIHNSIEYFAWVRDNIPMMSSLDDSAIIEMEIKSSLDIYTRIFVNEGLYNKDNRPLFIGYFMGYALGREFYDNFTIMNFPSQKSKDAIYVTYPISKSTKFTDIFSDTRLWG